MRATFLGGGGEGGHLQFLESVSKIHCKEKYVSLVSKEKTQRTKDSEAKPPANQATVRFPTAKGDSAGKHEDTRRRL